MVAVTIAVMMVALFFFFQAEDGIRDADVTGVQTCALPISQCRPDVAGDELLAQVFDVSGGCTGGQGLAPRRTEVFLLADIADHGDDLAGVSLLQPRNDDRSVQPARIGKHYFIRQGFPSA